MKKAIAFNPLDSTGRFNYINDTSTISATIYEYGIHFDILGHEFFRNSFYPLDADYFEYRYINFEPRLPRFLDFIFKMNPINIEDHYFLAVFITYLDIYSPTAVYQNRKLLDNCFSHTKHFVEKVTNDQSLLDNWYEKLNSYFLT